MENKEKLIKKIKNLLDLADDKNSLAEAETAAKMAQRLIMKYNIEEAELHAGRAAEIGESAYNLYAIQKTWEGKWIPQLFNAIAIFNFCKVITGKRWVDGKRRDILFVLGESTNVELVKFLSEQLINRLRIIRQKEWNTYQGDEDYHMFMRGFFKGAVYGIHTQLEENQAEFKEDESTALVISKNDEALTEYLDINYPNLGKARRTSTRSRGGYEAGEQTGMRINISAGIRGKSGTRSLGQGNR